MPSESASQGPWRWVRRRYDLDAEWRRVAELACELTREFASYRKSRLERRL
jgi:hypothetical protein